MKTITSRKHPMVHAFRELADTPDATGTRLLLDGVHLVRDAHAAGLEFEVVAVAAAHLDADTEEGTLAQRLAHEGVELLTASADAFAAMSPVRTPSGMVAIARRQASDAARICGVPDAFILVAVGVQDPGNLGSVVRAAEAGGVTGVLVCGSSANPFSWKALRGSMGSALRLPIVTALPLSEVMACLGQHGARTIAAVPRGGRPQDEVAWTGRVGLILGGEGQGLGDAVTAACDDRVTIPMAAPVESLNVAASAAILVYAARRQRTPPEPHRHDVNGRPGS